MRKTTHTRRKPIRLGFVALADSAPIVMASVLGLFEKHGVAVELQREVGWATIRDRIIYGELDAAHAPAGLVVAATLGLGSIQSECLTAMILSLNGNAITLSQELWKNGVRDGATLKRAIVDSDRIHTFGVVNLHSAHNFLLRTWLRSHGIRPDRDVQIVVVPPAQVHGNLVAGHLDGYCVGEPWNSLAVLSGHGWCVATSEDLAPRHPEKALMVRREFAERDEPEHVALIAALMEACHFCAAPENRERLIETLAQPEHVGVPIQALRMGMAGSFDYGHGRVEKHSSFHIFAGDGVNSPTADKADWVINHLLGSGIVSDASPIERERARECFRADIHFQALQFAASQHTIP
jgi:ABC-type nitrate/sulfonate/bicarbonate transport system substrate-binding protein